jgi:benzoyl-CoA reductase/2-hydroxyglutaryl-CoA dehydratase subunit BcrC/BadD/HgdB
MAVFCSYAPEELIHAAGFVPVRVRKRLPSSGAWGEHLQSYTCPLVRSLLEQGADGELSDFAGAMFAHSCDAMQALADIWRLRFPGQFAWVFNMPTRLGSPHTEAYLLAELAEAQAALEAHAGIAITDERLRDSITLCNRVRTSLARLDALRDRLAAADFYAAVLAAQSMPKDEYAAELEALIPALEVLPSRPSRARAIVSGAILDDLVLPTLADELRIGIVGDDVCTSARYWEGQVAAEMPLLRALAARALSRTPCPAKHRDGFHRGQALLQLARDRGAQGVIFYEQKFCEPHAFDYAECQRFLRDAGMPILLLEDDAGPGTAQWRTRLQAFAEMLESS